MNQNRGPKNKPNRYIHLTLYKGDKNILWNKESLFIKLCWKTRVLICRRIKLDVSLSASKIPKSRGNKELN